MDLTGIAEIITPRRRADLPPWREGMAILGGGTWLFSEPQPGISTLVDLTTLGWPKLAVEAAGLRIAATCRIADLARFAVPPAWQAASLVLPCCEALLGSFKIWNAATVGGNICLALPAGPMTTLATSLDGLATIWSSDGERHLPVRDLVIGDNRTALAPGEILREIFLPAAALHRRAAMRRQSLTPLGRSAALLIGTRDEAGRFALTITAATPRPVRLDFPALPDAAALREAIDASVTARGLWFDDIHGAPDWRRHLTLHFAAEIRRELSA